MRVYITGTAHHHADNEHGREGGGREAFCSHWPRCPVIGCRLAEGKVSRRGRSSALLKQLKKRSLTVALKKEKKKKKERERER